MCSRGRLYSPYVPFLRLHADNTSHHGAVFIFVLAVFGLASGLVLSAVVDAELFGVQAVDVLRRKAEQLADADPEEQHVGRLDAGVLYVAQLVLSALLGLGVPVLPGGAVEHLVALRGQGVYVVLQRAADLHAQAPFRGQCVEGGFLSEDRRCAIGFRRLAVIDPAGSHQPMSTPDGRLTVAFNGEIYNFRSLRAQLADRGVEFRTAGDTEVLLHLYRLFGREMLERLEGMFAFVIHDRDAGELFMARDRLGQKPLWYAPLPDRVVFASEANALLSHPAVDTALNAEAVTTYVTMGYIPAPLSIFKGVQKLLPGHWLLGGRTGSRGPERYWQPEAAERGRSAEGAAEAVRERLTEAVRSRLVSDVPLGALLSGGMDSAIIVGLMSETMGGPRAVKTFTAGFSDALFDERSDARVVAEHFGTEHTELAIEAAPGGVVDDVVGMYGEPFADSSALPTWLICRAAREHVTVALVGDGGDEVFGGYDRYRAMHLAETMGPAGYLAVRMAAAMVRPWAGQEERSRGRRLIRFADALNYPPSVQYFRYRRLFGPQDLSRLLCEDFAAVVDVDAPGRWFCGLYEAGKFETEVGRAQHHDVMTYLPDDLLVKSDIASMACSLELRAPMLDHRVVEMGLSLPVECKVSRGRGKMILREAFGDMLPGEVFRRPKRGFGAPIGRWLRGELTGMLRETLLDGPMGKGEVFRRASLEGLINDHVSGRGDHRHRLWALMVLGRWLALNGRGFEFG